MREILFRGKRSDSKGWTEGLPTYLTEYAKDMNEIDGIQCNRTRFNYDIHFETVGQFTGLTDKNGTKIFEGDIIVMDEYPFYDNGVLSYVGEVVWFENTFSFGFILNCVNKNKIGISTGVTENIEDDMVFEVIGNIHDNKDLIE